MKKIGLIASIGLFLLYYFKSKQNEISDEPSMLDLADELLEYRDVENICPNITIKTILQINKVESKKCYGRAILEITNNTSEDFYITVIEQSSSVYNHSVGFRQDQNKNLLGWTLVGAKFTKRIIFKDFGEFSGLTEEQTNTIKSLLDKADTSPRGELKVNIIESDVAFKWTNDRYYRDRHGNDAYRCLRLGMKDCYIQRVKS